MGKKNKMARLKISREYSFYERNQVAELTVELSGAVSIIAASVNLVHEKKGNNHPFSHISQSYCF